MFGVVMATRLRVLGLGEPAGSGRAGTARPATRTSSTARTGTPAGARSAWSSGGGIRAQPERADGAGEGMSRGHGKWEHAILETLKEAAAFYLTDLLPIPHTRSNVVALNRAARNLHDAAPHACLAHSDVCHVQATNFMNVYERKSELTTVVNSDSAPMQHLNKSADRGRAR
jgi:hypothetical protein